MLKRVAYHGKHKGLTYFLKEDDKREIIPLKAAEKLSQSELDTRMSVAIDTFEDGYNELVYINDVLYEQANEHYFIIRRRAFLL